MQHTQNADASANRTGAGVFNTTQWTEVFLAARENSDDATEALARLCQAYWYPLYACVRHQGHKPEDARDLTQEFFARLLENDSLRHADPGRGRFRAFLRTCLTNFLNTEWVKANAAKRGGGCLHVSLDAVDAERRFAAELPDNATPETIFERHWAATVLENTIKRLGEEYAAAAKTPLFDSLRAYTWGDGAENSYAEIGRAAGLSEGAVKVAAHRLRERYRELLRLEVARTVGAPEETDDELRHLLKIISG